MWLSYECDSLFLNMYWRHNGPKSVKFISICYCSCHFSLLVCQGFFPLRFKIKPYCNELTFHYVLASERALEDERKIEELQIFAPSKHSYVIQNLAPSNHSYLIQNIAPSKHSYLILNLAPNNHSYTYLVQKLAASNIVWCKILLRVIMDIWFFWNCGYFI